MNPATPSSPTTITVRLTTLSDEDDGQLKVFKRQAGDTVTICRASKSNGTGVPTRDNGLFRNQVLSREHAILRWQNDGVYIKDLNSTHGTRIQDYASPVTSIWRKLADGDLLTLGKDVARVDENGKLRTYGALQLRVTLTSHRASPLPAQLNPDGPQATLRKYVLTASEQLGSDDDEEGQMILQTEKGKQQLCPADEDGGIASSDDEDEKDEHSVDDEDEEGLDHDHNPSAAPQEWPTQTAAQAADALRTGTQRTERNSSPIVISGSETSSVRAISPLYEDSFPVSAPLKHLTVTYTESMDLTSGLAQPIPASPAPVLNVTSTSNQTDTVPSSQAAPDSLYLEILERTIMDDAVNACDEVLPSSIPPESDEEVGDRDGSDIEIDIEDSEGEKCGSEEEEEVAQAESEAENVESEEEDDEDEVSEKDEEDREAEEDEEQESVRMDDHASASYFDDQEDADMSEDSSQIFDTSPVKLTSPKPGRDESVSSHEDDSEPAQKKNCLSLEGVQGDFAPAAALSRAPAASSPVAEGDLPSRNPNKEGSLGFKPFRPLFGNMSARTDSRDFGMLSMDGRPINILRPRREKKCMTDASTQAEAAPHSSIAVQALLSECVDVPTEVEAREENVEHIATTSNLKKRYYDEMAVETFTQLTSIQDGVQSTDLQLEERVSGTEDVIMVLPDTPVARLPPSAEPRPKKGLPWRAAAKYTGAMALGAVAAVIALATLPELD